MAKDPAQVAAKWAQNLGASTQSIQNGVNAVTVAPTQAAAKQQTAYLNGIQQAVASGKWARGLQRVSLQDWQQAMISKGIPRVAAGASNAQPKMQAFLAQWLPYQDQLKQKLASMPRGTLQQNIARAVAAIEFNAQFKQR